MSDFEISNNVLVRYCGKESSVTIPEGIKIIGKSAFSYCNSIRNVIIPDSVITIGHRAFRGCENLERAVIPESVREIRSYAFYQCQNLIFCQVPDKAATLGHCIFSGAPLTESYPDGLILHHHVLMEYAGNEKTVLIPETVTKIRNFVFCFSDVETLVIPDTVKIINPESLYGCRKLRKVTVHGMTFCSEKETFFWNSIFQTMRFVRLLLENPESADIACLNKEQKLLFCLDAETFRKILETGRIFTRENIDQAIQYAIREQNYEKQILLLNYKYQHFSFADRGESLKL